MYLDQLKMRGGEAPHFARAQTGSAAIEFALILPLLLFMVYSVIVYGYLLVMQQSMTFAAQAGAEAAVAVDPFTNDETTYGTLVTQEAKLAAARVLDWLPIHQRVVIVGDTTGSNVIVVPPSPADPYVRVTLVFNVNSGNFFPTLNIPFPGIGVLQVPPLPELPIIGEASVATGLPSAS